MYFLRLSMGWNSDELRFYSKKKQKKKTLEKKKSKACPKLPEFLGNKGRKNARISDALERSSSGCILSFLPRLELLLSGEGVWSWKTWPKMKERSAAWGRWEEEALRTGFICSCLKPVLKQLLSHFILFWWLFCIFLKPCRLGCF